MQERARDNPIGNAIARVLGITGLKISELAKRAGIPESTARRVAAGQISPTFRTVDKLAQACGMSAGEFIVIGELEEATLGILAAQAGNEGRSNATPGE